jgi:hypothetical protein
MHQKFNTKIRKGTEEHEVFFVGKADNADNFSLCFFVVRIRSSISLRNGTSLKI